LSKAPSWMASAAAVHGGKSDGQNDSDSVWVARHTLRRIPRPCVCVALPGDCLLPRSRVGRTGSGIGGESTRAYLH
jgi:hypothetical protein